MIVRPHPLSIGVLLFSLKGSIIPVIWRRVMYTVLLSSLVAATHGNVYSLSFVLSPIPLTLWGLTLAIFLGFRNTVAYQRYWEARTLWGEIVIVTRNLCRQTHAFLPALAADERRRLLLPLMAFGYALRDHLRGTPSSADVHRLLDGLSELAPFARCAPPDALLYHFGKTLTAQLQRAGVSDVLVAQTDHELGQLTRALGGCERILNTPIPYPYILMLHRTVHIYCFLLPFCLVESLGWFTPMAVAVLAYTFFGLDALGDQIADPFDTQPNDLPLDALSRNLEIIVLKSLNEDTPAPIAPVEGVLP